MRPLSVLRHLAIPGWIARRSFPKSVLSRLETAIRDSEREHGGQLRFVVEGPLPLGYLFKPRKVQKRARDLFAALRVWDTEHNSGVLVYLQLIDRRIEIVADRGIAAKVPQDEWNAVCRAMEAKFRERRFPEGALEGIERITRLLAKHFPPRRGANELPDKPVVL